MNLYLLPLDRVGPYRVPRYLRARGQSGLNVRWALKDFGSDVDMALVAVDGEVNRPDVFAVTENLWTQAHRSNLEGFMRAGGISNIDWITGGADWREGWQRLAGFTQAMQSAGDDPETTLEKQDPAKWLGRRIGFGLMTLEPTSREQFLAEREANQWLYTDTRGVKWRMVGRFWISENGERAPVIMGGALPFTDTFTTGSNQGITSYNASYVLNTSADFQVLAASDDVHYNSATESFVHWGGDSFSADHYAQAQYSAIGNLAYMGVAARIAASAITGYEITSNSDDAKYFGKYVAGSYTDLASPSTAYSSGNTIKVGCEGTTITPYLGGAEDSDFGAQTDSSISSGSAGLTGAGASTVTRMDNFEADDIGGGGGISIPVVMHHRQQQGMS